MSFHIIRAVAKKKAKEAAGLFRAKRQRLDEHLPLGIKIGSLVEADEAALITFHGLVQFEFPSFPATVDTIGKIDLGEGVLAYRCYLQQTEAFLQLVTEQNELAECRLYMLNREIYPSTEEDWDLWLNTEDGIIGSPEILHGDPKELTYTREWIEGDHQAEPVSLHERFLKDSYGDNIAEEDQQAMSYFRVAYGDPNAPEDPERIDEYLLVSVGDGVIEIYLGIDLMPHEITVI